MTTGNVFQLVINDGKQDELLIAYDALKERIKKLNSDFDIDVVLNKIKKSHTIFINNTYKPMAPMAYTYIKAKDKTGLQKFGTKTDFIIPNGGTWVHDMVLHIRISGLSVKNNIDKVKYADLLGHRLLENVQFLFNGTVLDEYGTEEMNAYYQMELTSNKKEGWLRNMGQETLRRAILVANPLVQEYREYRYIGDGAQTLKQKHDDIDLWIPLLFWFNKSISNSFPHGKLPYGMNKVSIKLRKIDDLVYANDFGGGGKYNVPDIKICDLYTNQIETIPEIQDLILGHNKYMVQLIKSKKTFIKEVDTPSGSVLLNAIKYPTESLIVGFRPIANNQYVEVWYKNASLSLKLAEQAVSIGGNLTTNQAIYFHEKPVIENVGLKINDIDLYQESHLQFYSSYLPHTSNGFNTPVDDGWLLFNFSFDNKTNNPSGYINLAKNREIRLSYTNGNISITNKCNIIVIANIINFLIIKGDKAQMKFI